MTTNHVETKKGRTLTTITVILVGLLLYNLAAEKPDSAEGTIQNHSDYAKDQGIATVSALISQAEPTEIDSQSTIVSQVGATTYQLAGSLYTNSNTSNKTPYSWYVQIEAIPHCFDYRLHSCWVTISGPTIVKD